MYCDRTKIDYSRTILNKKISIITQSGVADGVGGETETDLLFHTTWARILPARAKELAENMRVEANVTHNIRIRYKAGITHKMTILFGIRKFEIKGIINPQEANKWLDMVCNEQF